MKARVPITALLIAASCAHGSLNRSESRGPHETDVKAVDVPVRGYQVTVETSNGTEAGELIAIDNAFVYLNAGESAVEWQGLKIARAQIVKVVVEIGPSASAATGIWTAVGCASTASHGFYFIFSGPLWLATGIPSSVNESGAAHATAQPDELGKLFQFARFPQGLPPSFGGKHREARRGPADAGVVTDATANSGG